jgi:hypothetical protein
MKTLIGIILGIIVSAASLVAWVAGIAIPVLLVTWIVGVTSFWQFVSAIVIWAACWFIAGFIAMVFELIGQ